MGELITNRRSGKSLSVSTNRSGCTPTPQTRARITHHTNTSTFFFLSRFDCCFTRHYRHYRSLSLFLSLFDLLDLRLVLNAMKLVLFNTFHDREFVGYIGLGTKFETISEITITWFMKLSSVFFSYLVFSLTIVRFLRRF